MHLELMRDKAREFPAVREPLAVRSARVWHCGYRSLAALATFTNLETLVVATYPDDSFAPLGALEHLQYLRVLHFPRATDLSPVRKLQDLTSLSLASLPSWDASGKTLKVSSLAPIAQIHNLQHLELFGVCPSDRALTPLFKLAKLRSARFSKYPKAEVQRFYEVTRVSDAYVPKPDFHAA
jgi:hypothetical protein